jgi:hypothetical protein
MLAAFAESARALDRDDYRDVAERNAGFLLRELRIGIEEIAETSQPVCLRNASPRVRDMSDAQATLDIM